MLTTPFTTRLLKIYGTCPKCGGQILMFSDGLGCLQCSYRPGRTNKKQPLRQYRNNGGKNNKL